MKLNNMKTKNLIAEKISSLIYAASILIFIIAFNFSDNPPSGWELQQLPFLNNRDLRDMVFTDSLTGYAITKGSNNGDSDYVIKTTNSGNNWFIVSTIYSVMNKINFINSNTGFICGNLNWGFGGLVLKTTNGGYNWFSLNASFALEFKDMSVLNKDTLMVTDPNGFNGGIYRTDNGGINWYTQYYTFGSNPEKIYMYNSQMGFMTKSSWLFKTNDGGFNWTYLPGLDGFNDMFFVDTLTGWKCSDSVRKTTNGGLTWITQNVINSNYYSMHRGILSFSHIGSDTIYGVGVAVEYPNLQSRGLIHRTTNGGLNWYFQVPDTSFGIGRFLTSNFINFNTGWNYTIQSFYNNIGTGVYTKTGGDSVYIPITSIKGNSLILPTDYSLFQNYPNPFNPNTRIKFTLRKRSFVTLKVHNTTGQLITILEDSNLPEGEYEVGFDGSNFSSGIYFYSFFLNGQLADTKKMILIR